MGEPVHGTPHPPTVEQGYEHSDVPIRPLMISLGILAAMLVVVSGVVAGLFYLFEASAAKSDPKPLPLAAEQPATPGPLLQVSPRQDLEEFREHEQRELTTPAWIDREAGVARIPIELAIKQVAERGLPEWPAVEGEAAQPGAGDRSPEEPAARAPQGTGQTTPIEGGREP
jgi:hypothetical protein